MSHEYDSSQDIEDVDEDEYEPEYTWGKCRACRCMGNCSVDDGYCGDCN